MKTLVTGATGFIGSKLVKSLIDDKFFVRALVRNKNYAQDLKKIGAEIVSGNICDENSINRAIKGIDVVFHLAALRGSDHSESRLWQVNVQGTENLLQASYEQGIKKFIFCSSIAVMGYDIKNPPADESYPYNPQDTYGITKMEAEKIAIKYYQEKGVPIVIVRPSSVYGIGSYRFFRWFKYISKRQFIMIGWGQNFIHLIYVDDLVMGLKLCVTSNPHIGNTYILAGSEYTTLKDFILLIYKKLGVPTPNIQLRLPYYPTWLAAVFFDRIFRQLGIRPPISAKSVETFKSSQAYDISKARRDLEFQPRYLLKEGINLTANWYRQNNLI